MCHQTDPDCTSCSLDISCPSVTHTHTCTLVGELTPDGGADTDSTDSGVTLIVPTYTQTILALTHKHVELVSCKSVICGHHITPLSPYQHLFALSCIAHPPGEDKRSVFVCEGWEGVKAARGVEAGSEER